MEYSLFTKAYNFQLINFQISFNYLNPFVVLLSFSITHIDFCSRACWHLVSARRLCGVCFGRLLCTFHPLCASFSPVWHLQIHLVWDTLPSTVTYCAQVSVEDYEKQKMTTSQLALNELLDDIVKDKTMNSKEKKRRLKQVGFLVSI